LSNLDKKGFNTPAEFADLWLMKCKDSDEGRPMWPILIGKALWSRAITRWAIRKSRPSSPF
jgi:hypothetical protein